MHYSYANVRKRVLSFFLAFVLALGLVPAMSSPAEAVVITLPEEFTIILDDTKEDVDKMLSLQTGDRGVATFVGTVTFTSEIKNEDGSVSTATEKRYVYCADHTKDARQEMKATIDGEKLINPLVEAIYWYGYTSDSKSADARANGTSWMADIRDAVLKICEDNGIEAPDFVKTDWPQAITNQGEKANGRWAKATQLALWAAIKVDVNGVEKPSLYLPGMMEFTSPTTIGPVTNTAYDQLTGGYDGQTEGNKQALDAARTLYLWATWVVQNDVKFSDRQQGVNAKILEKDIFVEHGWWNEDTKTLDFSSAGTIEDAYNLLLSEVGGDESQVKGIYKQKVNLKELGADVGDGEWDCYVIYCGFTSLGQPTTSTGNPDEITTYTGKMDDGVTIFAGRTYPLTASDLEVLPELDEVFYTNDDPDGLYTLAKNPVGLENDVGFTTEAVNNFVVIQRDPDTLEMAIVKPEVRAYTAFRKLCIPVLGVRGNTEPVSFRLHGSIPTLAYSIHVADTKTSGGAEADLQPFLVGGLYDIQADNFYVKWSTVEERYGYIQLRKANGEGTGLAGAQFTIYEEQECVTRAGTITTENDGSGVSTRLEWAVADGDTKDFWVKETRAPSGYSLPESNEPYKVTVKWPDNNTEESAAWVNGGLDILNSKSYGYIKLQKTRAEDGQPLSGAEFTIYNENNRPVGTIITTNSQWSYSGPLDLGSSTSKTFTLKETKPPQGYKPLAGSYPVTVTTANNSIENAVAANGGQAFVNDTPPPPDGELRKVDAWTEEGLAGAVFHFEGVGDTTGEGDYTSIEGGKIDVQWWDPTAAHYLPPGTYNVTETSAPAGYHLDSSVKTITLSIDPNTGDGVASGELVFENHEMTEIEIYKVASEDMNTPLQGAQFDLYIDGEKVAPGTTDEDGYIVWEMADFATLFTDPDKESWTITVVETNPPPGRLFGDKTEATKEYRKGDGPVLFEFDNPEPIPVVVEKTDESGNPLPGAKFDLLIDGEVVDHGTTDRNGRIEWKLFDYAVITEAPNETVFEIGIEETEAPPGYLKGDEPKQTKTYIKGQTGDITFEMENYDIITVKVFKTSDDGKPLPGAKFDLYIDNEKIAEDETDENGEIEWDLSNYAVVWNDVTDKTWAITVIETDPPPGYLLPEKTIHTAVYHKGDKVPIEFHVENYDYPEIVILKLDADTKKPVPGAVFTIEVDGQELPVRRTSDENGEVRITYEEYKEFLTQGETSWTITVTEVEAPHNYNKDVQLETNSYTLNRELILGGDPAVFEFYDAPFRSIEVRKLDATHNWRLDGAVFELESINLDDPTQGPIKREGTTVNGIVRWDDLPNGTYRITETIPPSGYELADPASQEVTLSSGDDPVAYVDFRNDHETDLYIRKVDAVTGNPIPGVTFQFQYMGDAGDSNAPFTDVTDENGIIFLDDRDPGWYQIKELSVPDDYVLNETVYTRYLSRDGETVDLVIHNHQDPQLIILKEDAQTGEPLAGARFTITTAGGTYVDTVETGVSGMAQLGGLEPGGYVVTEIESPAGHILDTTPKSFEIVRGQTEPIFLIFKNSQESNLYIRKEDADTHLPLAGAVFRVALSSGEVVRERVETGPDGIADVTGLEPGTYVVTEIEAPNGYLLNTESQTVYIREGETTGVLFRNNMPGGIAIVKIDAERGVPVPGAVFALYTVDDKFIDNYETGLDGIARIPDLEPGVYFVQEVVAPDGYILDDTKHKVTVTEFETAEIVIENYEESSLTILKVDENSNLPLPGAVFEIRSMEDELLDTVETNASGVATVNNLQPGWYKVKEIKAPTGYVLNDEEQLVEMVAGAPTRVTFVNTPETGITVRKLDADTQEPLSGAEFELRAQDGTLLGNYTTDASGTFVTMNVEPGVYYLVETKAPDGYTITNEETKVEVTEGAMPIVNITNHKNTTIQMIKVDAATGEYLEGAEFEVWTLNCTKLLGTYVTDKTGIAWSDPLPAGNYIVIESKAPAGYIRDEEHHHVQLGYDTPAIVKIENQPLHSLMIVKVSTIDDEPLMGAKFEVRTAEGDVVCEVTTDTTGTAHTPILEPGVYYVKEVEQPDGYLLREDVFRVEIDAEKGAAPLVVENTPAPSLVIFKGDSKTGRGVPGAIFKVETADGDFIGQYTTDAQGEALIRPINPGHYIVTEMQAPEGYLLSSPSSKTITVKAGVVNRVEFMDADKGSLVIRLEDEADGTPLPNGKFQLFFGETGELIAEGTTDNSGSIVWGNLIPGRYVIVQTYAPDGYVMVDIQKEEFVESGKTKIVVFKDATAGLVIEKLDRLTEEPLAGARFQVTRNEDNIVIGEYVTDVDGLALVSGLKPGMYTVEELVPPEGYAIDEESKLVHVKANEHAHVTFLDTPEAGITIQTVVQGTGEPVGNVTIEVWEQNGQLVNVYITDNTGVVQTDSLPSGFYEVKVTYVADGFTPVTREQVVEIKDGKAVTIKFEFTAEGGMLIYAVDGEGKGLPGMTVSITTIEGTRIGEYTVDATGMVKVPGLEPGWYVVTETKAPDGTSIPSENSQTVEVKGGGITIVKFVHAMNLGLQIRTVVKQTGAMVPGVKYAITTLEGTRVGEYTSDGAGLIHVPLEPGWYVVKMTELPAGYENFALCPSRNVEVLADTMNVAEFELVQMSSIRVRFVDGVTGAPVYNVRLLVKDGAGNIVGDFTSNNEGYVTLSQSIVDGGHVIEMLSAPDGYVVDTVPKTIDVLLGETTDIEWKLWNQAGQIQVHLTSTAYNSTLDIPAGSNLQGAVFEVYDPFTFQVLATIETDSYGVAATGGLPIGRYIIREKTPAPYFGLSGKETEVYIKVNNDVVRVEYQAAPIDIKVSHDVTSNNNVSPGTSMRYDFTVVNNDSDQRLDNFFWTIKIPTDAVRGGTLYTGKWSSSVFYKIMYKTNMNDYRVLAENLNSSTAYQYDLSSLAINVQGGEYVTEIRFEFGTVPGGFKPTTMPVFYGYVIPGLPNGYKVIMRSECGGKYGEQWVTASALWTTNIMNGAGNSGSSGYPSSLPTTGY